MSFKEIVYKSITIYFILVACITAGIAIVGTILDPEAQFGYDELFSPFIYAALGIIPNLLMYSKNELTNKQIILRKVIQLAVIEAEIVGVALLRSLASIERPETIIAMAVSVLVIYLLVNLIAILNSYFSAKELTKDLERYREENN